METVSKFKTRWFHFSVLIHILYWYFLYGLQLKLDNVHYLPYLLLRALKLPILCSSLETRLENPWLNTVCYSVIFSTFLHFSPLSTQPKINCAEITISTWTNFAMHCFGFLGPFVMTTEEEIQQAISDYRSGRNGFERARNWRSKIAGSFWNSALCIYLFMSVVAVGSLFCSICLLKLRDICFTEVPVCKINELQCYLL